MKLERNFALAMLAALGIAAAAWGDDWPQWLGPKRDGVWRENGLVEKFPKEGPKVRWRTPIGAGYAGPAVVGGKVYVTDRILADGAKNPDNPFAKNVKVAGTERILCLDEASGKILWKHEYDCPYQISYASGPRTTPSVDGDRVYAIGAMGNLICLDMNSGKVVWEHDLAKKYNVAVPLWGFSASPLVDGDRLICLVGGEGSVAVAFDKKTGKELWKALSAKEPGYCPPMIYEFGGKRQLIVWHPESINSLNPETGASYWTQNYGGKRMIKAALTIPTPRLIGDDHMFFTAFYDGPVMLKLNGTNQPQILWKGKGRGEQPDDTDGLHSIMTTPIVKDGFIYGICSYGELRCLDQATGSRVWSTHQATTGKSVRWGHAFIVAQGDRYVLFNEKGDLILANMSPKGYQEIDRANLLPPTNKMAMGRLVVWTHPAFANRTVYARNDREIVAVSLAKD